LQILNTGDSWFSDPADNVDGNHTYAARFDGDGQIPPGIYVAFEDLPIEGAGLDYNDYQFVFTNGTLSTPTPTAPPASTATPTWTIPPTPTRRLTPTPTPTATPKPSGGGGGDGGCTVTPHEGGVAWWLLVPALVLAWARRRQRG